MKFRTNTKTPNQANTIDKTLHSIVERMKAKSVREHDTFEKSSNSKNFESTNSQNKGMFKSLRVNKTIKRSGDSPKKQTASLSSRKTPHVEGITRYTK